MSAAVLAGDYEPYLEAIRAGRLDLPRCAESGDWVWTPTDRCPACGSADVVWTTVPDPVGTIFSFSVVHRSTLPEFADRVPYVLVIVTIGGTDVRIVGTLTGTVPDGDLVGRPVVPGFAESEGVPVITWSLGR